MINLSHDNAQKAREFLNALPLGHYLRTAYLMRGLFFYAGALTVIVKALSTLGLAPYPLIDYALQACNRVIELCDEMQEMRERAEEVSGFRGLDKV